MYIVCPWLAFHVRRLSVLDKFKFKDCGELVFSQYGGVVRAGLLRGDLMIMMAAVVCGGVGEWMRE